MLLPRPRCCIILFGDTYTNAISHIYLVHPLSLSLSPPPPSSARRPVRKVKSLRPVSLFETRFDKHGLVNDRRLMIVRPDPRASDHHHRDRGDGESPASHRFLTQRQSPSLATIEATEPVGITTTASSSVDDDDDGGGGRGGGGSGRARKKTLIRLSSSSVPDSHHVYVDVHPSALRALPVRYRAGLWGDVVGVADVGDEAAAFVSEVVCRDDPSFADVRVVSLLPDNATSRSVDGRYCPHAARVGYFGSLPHGGLTDGFPVSASSRLVPRPPPPTRARIVTRFVGFVPLIYPVCPVLSFVRSCADFGRDASVVGRT